MSSTRSLLPLLLSFLVVGCSSTSVEPDMEPGRWTLTYGEPLEASQCSGAWGEDFPTVLTVDPGEPGPSFPAEILFSVNGLPSEPLPLNCTGDYSPPDDPYVSSMFQCIGYPTELWAPDPSQEVRWPVAVELVGQWNLELRCTDQGHRYNFGGFGGGEVTLSVVGPCEGEDCTEMDFERGSSCIRGQRVTGLWAGCPEGEDWDGEVQCVYPGASVDCNP